MVPLATMSILHGVVKGMKRIDLIKQLMRKGMTHEEANAAIHSLVQAKFLRYNVVGQVDWHSQFLKKFLQMKSFIPKE